MYARQPLTVETRVCIRGTLWYHTGSVDDSGFSRLRVVLEVLSVRSINRQICSCRRQRKSPGSAWATRTGHYKLIDRSRSSRRKQIKRSISNHIILESLSMRFHGSAGNKFPLCSILPELFSFCFTSVHDIFSEGDLCCFDKPASFSVCWSSAWRPPGRDLAQREKHDGRKVATAEF